MIQSADREVWASESGCTFPKYRYAGTARQRKKQASGLYIARKLSGTNLARWPKSRF